MKPAVIYLDYNATTPCDPRVQEVMRPYFFEEFGNPASQMHSYAWRAQTAVEKAREKVALLIGANPKEITFTSGATESNNWVLLGLLRALKRENHTSPVHFLTSSIEHASILKTLKKLKEYEQLDYDLVNVNSEGFIDREDLEKKIRPSTRLISLIYVNNEIGTIQDLESLSKLCREKKIYLHTDATQAVGKMPFDVEKLGVDMVSASSHKLYGPKGVGFLYLRSRNPHVQIEPLIFGGGHENGNRSGTLNVTGIVGLGAACEIARNEMDSDRAHILRLRNLLFETLQTKKVAFDLNGPALNSPARAINNLNIRFDKAVELRLHLLTGLAMSPGSACQAENKSLSHVLNAIGLPEELIRCSLRLSLGRWTTEEEVLKAADILAAAFQS